MLKKSRGGGMEGETHRAMNVDGKRYVPYLIDDGDKVILYWYWLHSNE